MNPLGVLCNVTYIERGLCPPLHVTHYIHTVQMQIPAFEADALSFSKRACLYKQRDSAYGT